MAKRLESGQRQAQILQSALEIISQSGLRGLSMAELAHRVGVVPSAIYRHFPNKQRLIASIFLHLRDRVFANIEEACAKSTDPLERLHVILIQNVTLIRHFQAIPRIIMSDSVFSGSVEIRRQAFELVRSVQLRLAKIIADGQIHGQIRSDLDSQDVAVLYWGIMPPMTILWMISDGRFDVNRHASLAWDLFRRAVSAK